MRDCRTEAACLRIIHTSMTSPPHVLLLGAAWHEMQATVALGEFVNPSPQHSLCDLGEQDCWMFLPIWQSLLTPPLHPRIFGDVLTFASNANEAFTDHCIPGACVFANTIDLLYKDNHCNVLFCRMDTLNQHVECADISTHKLWYTCSLLLF